MGDKVRYGCFIRGITSNIINKIMPHRRSSMNSNFSFLFAWLDLSLLGETAELNLKKDPNISAIKCRQLLKL
jgi:hypothetical protein